MATIRKIDPPEGLRGAQRLVLSPDGRSVACRHDGARPGLYRFEIGGGARPVRLDEPGRRFLDPAWSAAGDLLYRIEGPDGRPRVGATPAEGRGSPVEYEGTGLAVDVSGRLLAVACPGGEGLRVAQAALGNAPFREPLRPVAALGEAEPARPIDLELTADGRWALMVRRLEADRPSLWSFPLEGGDAQQLALALPPGGQLSFSLAPELLAVLEVRRGDQPSSRLYVHPLAPGSLGALRLGPARDLLFVRHALAPQRPGFSPDAKRLAVLDLASPLPGEEAGESILTLLPTAGGHPERPLQSSGLRGSARFLEPGELVVEGTDRLARVSL